MRRQTETKVKAILRFSDLEPAGVHFCQKHLRDLERRGEFPARVALGPHSVGWLATEIAEWVASKIAARSVVPLQTRGPGRPPKPPARNCQGEPAADEVA